MNAWALNAANFGHKKGTGMEGRTRNVGHIVQSLQSQEGGITARALVLVEIVDDRS